ncbi:MAG: hypothetical protein OXF24_03640 [Hyphomicrobiales bacterium]|nr:hypothetical protein [Hyphomicrobiales bacterium]
MATIFVIASMAVASSASPVFAGGEVHPCLKDWTSSECIDITDVRDPDQLDENDAAVAESDDALIETETQTEDEPGEPQ